MPLSSWDTFGIIIGGLGTLAIFSFLIRENPFFRFFEHLYIGIAAGFGILLPVKSHIWPKILVPMLGLDVVVYPDGTLSRDHYQWPYLLYLAPMIFGLFFYFIYSRRFNWMSKLVIGFLLGSGGGLACEGFFNFILPQLQSSFKPLVVSSGPGQIDLYDSFNNSLFVFALLAVMYYFFFSFRSAEGVTRRVSSAGRWLMMIYFGAYFGSTVMARMALLVERIQFLFFDWSAALAAAFKAMTFIS